MSVVYVILAEGFEETEALAPADILLRAGQRVQLVSIGDELTVTGSHGIRVQADILLSQCELAQAALIVLPGGGLGTKNLEECTALADLLLAARKQGVLLAAICAAPRILGRLGLLAGRRACCYPGNEELLLGAEVCYDKVAVNEDVITGRSMGAAIDFGLALAERLSGAEAARRVAQAILYTE